MPALLHTGTGPDPGRTDPGRDSQARDTLVRADHVCKSFGARPALQDLTCTLKPGQITGLVGPDAAGKTTFLRLLAGLLRVDAGELSVFGRRPQELLDADPNSIGYMPQKFGLYEDLTVLANLRLHARLRGLNRDEGEALFARLLAFTGLDPFGSRLAGRLSGGMKQKLGIACALLGSPRLLLLDEPGVGVDPLSRRDLWHMVAELADSGMTIVWSTAYLEEAERCPDIIMLDAGRILYAGPPQDFLETVEGQVHLVPGSGDNRADFEHYVREDGIRDVVIQGSSLRLLTAKDCPQALRTTLERTGRTVPPRLEDAYMAALGGINASPSPYARAENRGHKRGGEESLRPAIVARGLTKCFGSFTAARDISFSVRPGEICGLLGPNGAGKSTTFRMLCGLLKPTSGSCEVAGIDLLSSSSAARANMGYMAQKFSLYPDIPVAANIRLFADLYGLDKATRTQRTQLLAESLGLEDHLSSITETLPLGLKQRLALLCATLHNPAVLFLDEPTSGVDVRTRRDFWKHILAMTETGTAVLVTTHCMDEAEYCDTICLIYQGAMIHYGTPEALKRECCGEARGLDPTLEDPTLEDAFIAAIQRWHADHEE